MADSVDFLTPPPQKWLTEERLTDLQEQLSLCESLIRQSGYLTQILAYWVRDQVADDADVSGLESIIDQQVADWCAVNSLEKKGLSVQLLRRKLLVSEAVKLWSRHQWQPKLQSLYLQKKTQLDCASCRLLRNRDKFLCLELYHRVKSGENSFAELARTHGEGPERRHDGFIELRPLHTMPLGLSPLLQKLSPGELSLPLRLGESFCLVQLDQWRPSVLDAESEEWLLQEQFDIWANAVVNLLLAALVSKCDHSALANT